MPTLPASGILDARLIQLLEAPGCALCTHSARAGAAYLDSLLFEGVTDPQLRRQLRASRGLCPRHTHQLMAAERREHGGTTNSGVLLSAIAQVRAGELQAASARKGAQRQRALEDARRPPQCLACRREDSAVAEACTRLASLAVGSEWQAALGGTDFCLDHLLMVLAAVADDGAAAAIARQQLTRIAGLRELLDGLAHKSSYDRRHLLSDEERRSPAKAAALLGQGPNS